MFNLVAERHIWLERFAELTSEAPAKLYGLCPCFGAPVHERTRTFLKKILKPWAAAHERHQRRLRCDPCYLL